MEVKHTYGHKDVSIRIRPNTTLYEIVMGGELPKELQGLFTTPSVALEAIARASVGKPHLTKRTKKQFVEEALAYAESISSD